MSTPPYFRPDITAMYDALARYRGWQAFNMLNPADQDVAYSSMVRALQAHFDALARAGRPFTRPMHAADASPPPWTSTPAPSPEGVP